MQFKLDGANLGAADATAPYWASWNTSASANGTHILTAVVTDSLGQTATSPAVSVEVANHLMQLYITSPINGAAVAGTINVIGLVSSGTLADISRVQFDIDGANLGSADTTAPYSTSWNTTSATDGLHYVGGRVWDTLGSNGSEYSPVGVWVANALPIVSIGSPANGSTVSSTISLFAGYSGIADITRIHFNLDGKYLGTTDIMVAFRLDWDTTSAVNGAHSLTAVGTDVLGRTSTSTAISVTVANAAGGSAPVITSALSSTGTIATAFSYQIAATNSPTSFNATGLPAGLSVNTVTGLISGTPTTAATSSVSISAVNAKGTGAKTLMLYVYSACDVNLSGATNVVDVQLQVNQAMGVAACTSDLNRDGVCNVIDVQRDVNAALGGPCVLGP